MQLVMWYQVEVIMILDLDIPAGDLYILTLISILALGLLFTFFGKLILDIKEVEFLIGGIAGGLVAYILLWGLNSYVTIPTWFMLLAGAVIIFVGGLVGKGTIIMLLALFSSFVITDALIPFLKDQPHILIDIIRLLLFFGFVAISGKFLFIFSAFLGGSLVAIAVGSAITGLDDGPLRLMQLTIAALLCILGSISQHFMEKRLYGGKEEIIWVPSEGASGGA